MAVTVRSDTPEIILASEMPFPEPSTDGFREGEISFKPLFHGDPTRKSNYGFAIVRLGKYHTPRHRHNYEQVRFALKGRTQYATDRHIDQGQILFQSEGVMYGPQDIEAEGDARPEVLALQYGGASGDVFMTGDPRMREAIDRLKQRGSFADGIYTWSEDGQRRNKDGYEAMWEEANGRPLAYVKPRYVEPVLIDPGAFTWVAASGERGISYKRLGTFGEREVRIGLIRWERGATHTIEGLRSDELGYVIAGALRTGGTEIPTGAAFRVRPGQAVTIEATSAAESYFVSLPVWM